MATESRDARLAALKPGDEIVMCGVGAVRFGELIAGWLVQYFFPYTNGTWGVAYRPATDIVLPDPPKAKPGVVYQKPWRSGFQFAVGTSSGQVFECYDCQSRDFTPDWQEVAEP